jgi:hypothetical protein
MQGLVSKWSQAETAKADSLSRVGLAASGTRVGALLGVAA